MNKKTKKKLGAWEVGAGVAAGIAGALVAGYLAYEKTKPQQKKLKTWVASARRDAARELKKLRMVSASEYERLATTALRRYGAIQKASAPEIAKAISEAKAEWKHLQTEMKKVATPKKAGKMKIKPAKKAAKKKK